MFWQLSDTISSIRRSAARCLVVAAMGSVVSACDYVERWAADPQPSMTGGGWLTNYSSYKETFDLISALDPENKAGNKLDLSTDGPIGPRIDRAFEKFYDPSYNSIPSELRRNRV